MKSQSSNLDGIRAIAVCLVVLSHVLLMLGVSEHPDLYSVHAMGRVGVAIFFVHTTLVLMQSLDRHGSSAIPFYIRRFFRIYPLSVVAVLFAAAVSLGVGAQVDQGQVLSNLLLVQSITEHRSAPDPLWSLPFEVQMYLVLPAIYLLTKSRHADTWAAALLGASVVAVLAVPPDSLAFRLGQLVPCFLPGVVAYVLSQRVQAKSSPLLLLGVVIGLGVIAIPMLAAAGIPEVPLLWLLCLVLGVTIPYCRDFKHERLEYGTKTIATYSYGIYITHTFALGMVGASDDPTVAQWLAMMILLVGLPYVCYHGIEKRGIALGARLADRWEASKRQNFGGAMRFQQASIDQHRQSVDNQRVVESHASARMVE